MNNFLVQLFHVDKISLSINNNFYNQEIVHLSHQQKTNFCWSQYRKREFSAFVWFI